MLSKEMMAANARNWLRDLAIGAKAASKRTATLKSVARKHPVWEASTFDNCIIDNRVEVFIHSIKELAELVDIKLQYREYTVVDEYYTVFTGEHYFEFNGVIFAEPLNTLSSGARVRRRIEERKYHEG